MEAVALASGSSGNCFYVSNSKKSVLVDVGISCRQIEERLAKIGKKASKIDGIFITHEHGDHVKGADVLARKYNIPIYGTKKTLARGLCQDKDLLNPIKNDETVKLGKMQVEAFSKCHDGGDPVSYSLFNDKRVSVITDVGHCCQNVIDMVSNSRILFLESNHSLDMLESGNYPYHVKRRVKSDKGHLSNYNSALCVLEHGDRKLKNIILSHLSENNNRPEIALESFKLLKERKDLRPEISVSNKYIPTRLFKI